MPNQSKLVDALRRAEQFMSGFEGDEMQEGIDEDLKLIRDVLAQPPVHNVRVETLEWKDIEWGVSNIPCAWDAIAVDIHRRYRVRWTSGDYTLFINGESKARYLTAAEAKAAAQSDYEKRQTPPPVERGGS